MSSPLVNDIAKEILELIRSGTLQPGQHLSAQQLAERFDVSRSPVREALQSLTHDGVVAKRANRGFFVGDGDAIAKARKGAFADTREPSAYLSLADDWLNDRITEDVTEQFVRKRYKLTKAQVNEVLNRASQEGWAERKQGYGWRLLPVVKTSEALDKIYRFRAVVEPAGLLEPTFAIDPEIVEKQRANIDLFLSGGLEHLSPDRILLLGAGFHADLALLSGNPFFHQAIIRLNKMRLLMEYRTMPDREQVLRQWREHREILDLVTSGDVAGASYALRRHLSYTSSRKRSID